MKQKKNEIAYQNKDITSKIFAGKSFQVYGVELPKIKQVLPTDLPAIQANELRVDNLFLLEDNTFLLVDYESVYKAENKLKYLEYVLRVLQRYQKVYGMEMKIRVLIIYTADVKENSVKNVWDVYSLKMNLDRAFLSNLNSEQIKTELTNKGVDSHDKSSKIIRRGKRTSSGTSNGTGSKRIVPP